MTFFQQQIFPECDFAVFAAIQRQILPDLQGEIIRSYIQHFGGQNQIAGQLVNCGQLETGIASPGGDFTFPVFRRSGKRHTQFSICSGFQKGVINLQYTVHEIVNFIAEKFNISGVAAVVEHHLGHPGGTGVIDGTGPETAHADAAVIDGVREHISVVDPGKAAGVVTQGGFP